MRDNIERFTYMVRGLKENPLHINIYNLPFLGWRKQDNFEYDYNCRDIDFSIEECFILAAEAMLEKQFE